MSPFDQTHSICGIGQSFLVDAVAHQHPTFFGPDRLLQIHMTNAHFKSNLQPVTTEIIREFLKLQACQAAPTNKLPLFRDIRIRNYKQYLQQGIITQPEAEFITQHVLSRSTSQVIEALNVVWLMGIPRLLALLIFILCKQTLNRVQTEWDQKHYTETRNKKHTNSHSRSVSQRCQVFNTAVLKFKQHRKRYKELGTKLYELGLMPAKCYTQSVNRFDTWEMWKGDLLCSTADKNVIVAVRGLDKFIKFTYPETLGMLSLIDTILFVSGIKDMSVDMIPTSVFIFTPSDIPNSANLCDAKIVLPQNVAIFNPELVAKCMKFTRQSLYLILHGELTKQIFGHNLTQKTLAYNISLFCKEKLKRIIQTPWNSNWPPLRQIISRCFHTESERWISFCIHFLQNNKGNNFLWQFMQRKHLQLSKDRIKFILTGKKKRGRPPERSKKEPNYIMSIEAV